MYMYILMLAERISCSFQTCMCLNVLASIPKHVNVIWIDFVFLQVVFFMYLWSIDIDAVLTGMSCFHLLCEEADIRCGSDEMAVTQILPNYNVYADIAQASTVLTTGKCHKEVLIVGCSWEITLVICIAKYTVAFACVTVVTFSHW